MVLTINALPQKVELTEPVHIVISDISSPRPFTSQSFGKFHFFKISRLSELVDIYWEQHLKGTSAENHFGRQIKPLTFLYWVWGFKSCNFVHSANARPFVLGFWPFQVRIPKTHHLELWRKVPCPGPSNNCTKKDGD